MPWDDLQSEILEEFGLHSQAVQDGEENLWLAQASAMREIERGRRGEGRSRTRGRPPKPPGGPRRRPPVPPRVYGLCDCSRPLTRSHTQRECDPCRWARARGEIPACDMACR